MQALEEVTAPSGHHGIAIAPTWTQLGWSWGGFAGVAVRALVQVVTQFALQMARLLGLPRAAPAVDEFTCQFTCSPRAPCPGVSTPESFGEVRAAGCLLLGVVVGFLLRVPGAAPRQRLMQGEFRKRLPRRRRSNPVCTMADTVRLGSYVIIQYPSPSKYRLWHECLVLYQVALKKHAILTPHLDSYAEEAAVLPLPGVRQLASDRARPPDLQGGQFHSFDVARRNNCIPRSVETKRLLA